MPEDILNEATDIAQCRDCPWYKSCAMPMRFSPEDIQRQIQSQQGQGFGVTEDETMQNMMANMAQAVQNSMVEACPVFINRLRTSPKLAERIKKIMQNWSDESV